MKKRTKKIDVYTLKQLNIVCASNFLSAVIGRCKYMSYGEMKLKV